MNIQTPMTPDFTAIKGRQQMAWSSGDYAVVGTTLQIVGELLCEAVDLRSNALVLDVAAGNGNATLAAARRFADVISTDYVGALLDRGRKRARAEGLTIRFREADAEALPFEDAGFDVVLSTFGVMFAPDQAKAAKEMLRVCRPGGKIGMANWTPDGFIGRLFKIIGKYVPPAPGMKSPAMWGSHEYLEALFGAKTMIVSEKKYFKFRYKSAKHMLDTFRTYYGPVLKTFEAIGPSECMSLEAEILTLMNEFNGAMDGTLVVPSEYLEVVVTRTP